MLSLGRASRWERVEPAAVSPLLQRFSQAELRW